VDLDWRGQIGFEIEGELETMIRVEVGETVQKWAADAFDEEKKGQFGLSLLEESSEMRWE
jgi:hypothetical protein